MLSDFFMVQSNAKMTFWQGFIFLIDFFEVLQTKMEKIASCENWICVHVDNTD